MYGFDEPGAIFLTCYRILRAVNDPRAGEILRQGYDLIQETAAKIEDEGMRPSFLERVPENRELIKAWEERWDEKR